jgi:enamine deaminase RidA (YjgF/YER057c/UK114 family)
MHGIQAGYSPEAQAALMFERGEKVLASAGLTWHNVVCTRIYMKRLLEWYKEFNGVRNLFYRKLGLIGDGRYDVPSSTGIQGKMSDDCECVMDIFAASKSPGKPAFRKLHNPLQSEATDYGSSFARGARVDFGDAAYVVISGTASIDGKGKSVFVGDPAAQSRQTMDSFESVLKAGGGGISDLVQGTCFCKDASYAGAMEQEMLRRGWPEFPWPMVVADVCRHDLLVEIDGAAVTTGTR